MSDAAELPPVSLAGDGFLPHTSHWGVFSARLRDGALAVRPYAGDPDPNGIIGNFPAALRHRCLLYTSPSPRDKRQSRMPSSA